MSERMWEDLREARAERDALRRVLAEKCDALVWKRLVGAEMQLDEVRAERDRLRRELETLRDGMDRHAHESDGDLFDDLLTRVLKRYAARIDAILSGGES